MKRAFFIASLVLIVGSGHGHAQSFWAQQAARESLASIFEKIEAKGPAGDLIEELERFVKSYPRSGVTDEALFRLAEIELENKKFRKAVGHFQKILDRFPESRFRSEALYGLGYSQYRSGRMIEAKTTLRSVVESPSTTLTMKVKARRLLETISEVASSPLTEPEGFAISALLPLKGVYSKFGEAALKGILLAADVFGSGTIEVKPVDTAGGGPWVEKRIIEISTDARVMGLVGPLASKTAQAAAKRAQKEKIPIIVLSQKQGVADTGNYVFRNFLTPATQAESIATYAYDMLEKRKFAVLYPTNRYGVELARRFKKEIEALGGKIVNEVSYKPGQKDFAEELEFLFGIEVEEEVKGRRYTRRYTPTVEIDALYIPDYPEAVGQIAPYLAFYSIKEVQLLGSNGWNSPRLLKLAGEYVEGSVFVDGFFSGSERPGAKQFTERFTKVYGHPPGVIEAQAYDAAMMLMAAVTDGGGSRADVRDTLEEYYVFEGATGPIRFDYSGDAVKRLFLLTVERKKIVEIF